MFYAEVISNIFTLPKNYGLCCCCALSSNWFIISYLSLHNKVPLLKFFTNTLYSNTVLLCLVAIGGIISLFLGASFMSILELPYFLFIRLTANFYNSVTKLIQNKKKSEQHKRLFHRVNTNRRQHNAWEIVG